jgi:hypothetical protein
MAAENGTQDPYDAVLADLRAKRDKLNEAISVIESVRGLSSSGTVASAFATQQPEQRDHLAVGDLLGMTIADAAIKILGMRRKTLGNADFMEEFKRGGLVLSSADPMNVINSVLNRRFHQVGDVVRVSRGMWGLQQWYPNRNFKKKATVGSEPIPERDSTSPEPLSEPITDDPQD